MITDRFLGTNELGYIISIQENATNNRTAGQNIQLVGYAGFGLMVKSLGKRLRREENHENMIDQGLINGHKLPNRADMKDIPTQKIIQTMVGVKLSDAV